MFALKLILDQHQCDRQCFCSSIGRDSILRITDIGSQIQLLEKKAWDFFLSRNDLGFHLSQI